jgi:hypothetical protein
MDLDGFRLHHLEFVPCNGGCSFFKDLYQGHGIHQNCDPIVPRHQIFRLRVQKIEANSSATAEKAGALAAVTEMMDDVLPAVFFFLEHGDEDISSTTFQVWDPHIKSSTFYLMYLEERADS